MTSKSNWWTSGFFPGVLWYLYEVNGNDSLKMYAENYTKRIENQKYTTDNHDVGFMLYCSFGNGLRLTGNDDYRKTLLQGSESLSTRFRPQVGCIRSWDWNQKVWEYPVIIDNLMNLEMLMWASKNSDDPKFEEIAKSHADVTMKYHFRSDYSSYHVISYDTISGLPEKKNTCQGYAHESCWARGQGWALYGYTMMYRETGQEKYLRQSWEDETYVVTRIEAMLADKPDALRGVERVIKEIEREQGVQYAPLQRQAVEFAAKEELLLLTGGPGTGKTTSVRAIVALFERMGLNVLLAAPTGRAAKRMGELCDRDAQTIHRMLGMTFNDQTGEVTFTKGEKEPLEADALIVDETSMVDLSLMRALLAALRPGCRLVLVGDPDQLPSVGAGNVFSDLIRSGRIATVALRDIFRQAGQSMIVRNAHLVNTGMPPKLKNAAANDFFFLPRRDSVRLVETVVELCKTRLPDKMGIPADELQVLTPTRRGDAGTRSLNFALQAALNPPKTGKQERRFGELVFREGDRVMQTRNDYDVVWQKEDGTAGTGIFNGDVGKIAKIDPSGELLEIVFDDRTATYTSDMLAELDMAYAMTVHKAQGSEYRGVVFVGAPCAPSLMVRGVLYTAITRARELLVIVGDDSAVNKMAENDRRSRRYSGLKWRLRKGGEEK